MALARPNAAMVLLAALEEAQERGWANRDEVAGGIGSWHFTTDGLIALQEAERRLSLAETGLGVSK
jgi:hypothetical protein